MSADADLIAQAMTRANFLKATHPRAIGYADDYEDGVLLGALVSALEQAQAERREAEAVIAQKEWEREEQVGRAEASEADLARALATVEMYRANIDTIARSLPACTLRQQLLDLNEDARGSLAAGSGDGR